MAKTYKGTSGPDIVNQKNDSSHNWLNIYTYGGADEITLRLGQTFVQAGNGNDVVKSNIEFQNDVYLQDGDDTYTGNGFTNHGNRYDRIYGGSGSDTFNISTSVSKYYGDGGNDTFNSVGYSNYINGGKGTDTVSYLRQDNDSFLSGRGVSIDLADETAFTGANRVEVLLNIEHAKGTSYADNVFGDGGNNKLWGMDGYDCIKGRDGKDTLYGGNGNDNLYGGNNADKLIGGKGYDFLWGDDGADTFIFQSAKDSVNGSQRDVIKDFSRSEGDLVDVSAIADFTFIGKSAFSGTEPELRFANNIIYGDVDGDGKADFQIKVAGVSTMHNSDFIL